MFNFEKSIRKVEFTKDGKVNIIYAEDCGKTLKDKVRNVRECMERKSYSMGYNHVKSKLGGYKTALAFTDRNVKRIGFDDEVFGKYNGCMREFMVEIATKSIEEDSYKLWHKIVMELYGNDNGECKILTKLYDYLTGQKDFDVDYFWDDVVLIGGDLISLRKAYYKKKDLLKVKMLWTLVTWYYFFKKSQYAGFRMEYVHSIVKTNWDKVLKDYLEEISGNKIEDLKKEVVECEDWTKFGMVEKRRIVPELVYEEVLEEGQIEEVPATPSEGFWDSTPSPPSPVLPRQINELPSPSYSEFNDVETTDEYPSLNDTGDL